MKILKYFGWFLTATSAWAMVAGIANMGWESIGYGLFSLVSALLAILCLTIAEALAT